MQHKTTVSFPHEVTLHDAQIAREKLINDVLKVNHPDRVWIDDDGDLMREDDYGHHRGGVMSEKVREATELDKAIILVLESLEK